MMDYPSTTIYGAVLNLAQIETLHLDLEVDPFTPLNVIWNQTQLLELQIYFQSSGNREVELSNAYGLTRLERLFTNKMLGSLSSIADLQSTLKELRVKKNTALTGLIQLGGLPGFTKLEIADFDLDPSVFTDNIITVPSSLKWLSTSISLPVLEIQASGAVVVGESSSGLSYLGISASNASFVLKSMPASVERLELRVGSTLAPDALPDLTASQLTSFSLIFGSDVTNYTSTVDNVCKRLPMSKMASLTVLPTSNSILPLQLPCLPSFANLTSLTIQNGASSDLATFPASLTSLTATYFRTSPAQTLNWTSLASALPNLVELDLSYLRSAVRNAFPGESLHSMTRLERFSAYGARMAGTLPPHLFASMPVLKHFNVSNNFLTGDVPWFGWGNLRTLRLDQNSFSSWRSLNYSVYHRMSLQTGRNETSWTDAERVWAPPRFLTEINLATNSLTDLPNDATFASFTSLETLDISYGSKEVVTGLLPSVFTIPPLTSFKATGFGFSGPIATTSIASPKLVTLDIRQGAICGSLPQIENSVSPLATFQVSQNTFTGDIPTSYGYHVFKTYDISDNALRSNVSTNPPFAIFPSQILDFKIGGNHLFGPAFKVDTLSTQSNINMAGTDMDLCTGSSGLLDGPYEYCTAPESACVCAILWKACSTFEEDCLIPSPPTSTPKGAAPSTEQSRKCVAEKSRLEAPDIPLEYIPQDANCPLPAPQGPFVCLSGRWISTKSVELTTISIPPGTTTVISGNLTITQSVVVSGVFSSITVEGCIFFGDNSSSTNSSSGKGTVTITLSTEDLKEIEKQGGKITTAILSSASGNNCTGSSDLSATQLDVKSGYSSCKKVKVQKASSSTKTSMVAVFSVDNSKCTMIIAVPTVICSVIALTAVGAVIIVLHSKSKFGSRVRLEQS